MLTKHRLSSVSVLTKRASNRALNARQNDGGLLMRKSHALRLHVAHPCVQKRGSRLLHYYPHNLHHPVCKKIVSTELISLRLLANFFSPIRISNWRESYGWRSSWLCGEYAPPARRSTLSQSHPSSLHVVLTAVVHWNWSIASYRYSIHIHKCVFMA